MRNLIRITLALAIAAGLAAGSIQAQVVKVDARIAEYKKTSGVSGNLNSIGSDTLNNLMTLWAEGFQREYPNVRIQIEGKGSSTAPPALIAGTAQLGPMSRTMKDSEVEEFEKKYGYKPTPIRVALDGLGIYVNKDNPLEKITLPQVDAVFSKTRKGGYSNEIRTWDQLRLPEPFAGKPISLYGRNSASGTYGYFKEHALYKGDYRDEVKEQPGSASVVQGVTEDLYGIGYSGIGYSTSGVKTLKVASKDGDPFYGATYEEIEAGRYPLSRFLYVYVNKAPNKPFDALVAEFLRFALSRAGQEIVVKDGYMPLPAKVVEQELGKLN